MKKRLFAGLLALCMTVNLMSATAFAASGTTVAKIGETSYGTFSEALTVAKAMTGDVTVEINDRVTLNTSLTGSYDSIKFVGMNANAEIYLDVQGYITATGENVTFENLTLSKSQTGGHIANAGFMNVAFGVYEVAEASYIGCTFANGAYASSGSVTFEDCEFYRSNGEYSLWAYGDVDVVVDRCIFEDFRGIKMYDEAHAGTASVTVKNTDFSALSGERSKPAIVLTYGESVTLKNNTYSSTGVFELDLDGDPNGTPVTSDVPPTCINDNGACGVLVGGKIYTTVAQAAEVAVSGSTVTLLHNSAETVEFVEGVTLDKNGFTAAGVTVVEPVYVAQVGESGFESLQSAIDAADEKIVKILDNMELTSEVTIPAGKTITLDLNGKTIAGTDNVTGSFGLINVQPGADFTLVDSSENKTGKITLEATSNRGWSAYSSVISNQRGKVTVNAGVIEHLGGTNMAYGIDNLTNGKGTYAETVINGGIIKSPYRAIRQFLNGVEAKNILTINGGTVDGTNKSIWVQDTNTAANTGTLSVGANAIVKGNVYLDVTEGSSEWPVTVSISKNSLKDGSEVITENIPSKYSVEEDDGKYIVISGDAKVGNDVYETLAGAVAAANGKTVTVLRDTVVESMIVLRGGQNVTVEGDGKTITFKNTEYGFGVVESELTLGAGLNIVAEGNTCPLYVQNGTAVTSANIETTAGNKYSPIMINGKYSGNITINGGNITSGNPKVAAVYWPGQGSLTVNGGTITGASAIYFKSGDLKITDGVFVGNGAKVDYSYIASGNQPTGAAIVLENVGKDGYESIGSVAVSGGTFTSINAGAIESYGAGVPTADPVTGFITDGKFSSNVEAYVAATYHVVKNGENYEVHPIEAVPATSATCTATGTKAHYRCVTCKKTYSDAAGKVPTTDTVASAKGHKLEGKDYDGGSHWSVCTRCGAKGSESSHSFSNGKCSCGYTVKVEVYVPETQAPATTTPETTTQTTQTTTTTTQTTTKPAATEESKEPVAVPVEEVVVDTKIVEEVATEEVKAVVKETVTVAEVKEVEKETEAGTVTVTEVKVAVTTETVDKVIENTEAGATVILPLTEVAEEGQAVTEAAVAVEALEKIVEAEAALTVEFEGVKVTFESETIKAIAEQAKGSTIELRVVPVEHHELNEEQKAVLEAHDVAVRVSAQIFSDGEYIGDFKGGKARIAIPFTPVEGRNPEDHKVYFVDDNGEMTLMPATYVDGYMVFETGHFSDYVIVYDEVASAEEGPSPADDDMVVDVTVEEAEKEGGLPIVPIAIIVVAVILVVAFIATRRKNDEE